MNSKNFLAAICVAASLNVLPTVSAAVEHDSNTVLERLSIANALRSNSQKMARLSCFIFGGVDAEPLKLELAQARADFDRYSRALIDGDAELGLKAERSERVRRAVRDVRESWPMLGHHIGRVAEGAAVDAAWMAQIDLFSVTLLQDANDLSTRIANVYGESFQDVPLILALTVEMAGRQIMRTEKAGKEACLIGTGVNPVDNRANLEQSVTLFSATLDALINGYPGLIMAAPNEEIRAKLEQVRETWAVSEALLTTLYQGGEITGDDRYVVGRGLAGVAGQMADIAALYETLLQE